MYEDFGLAKSIRTTRQMSRNQHYKLTRIFIPFLVTLILASSSGLVWGKTLQTGSIKGKVVADIPDQRKALSGVTVTLSSSARVSIRLRVSTGL